MESTVRQRKSYQHPPLAEPKKTEMKKRHSPLGIPYREKAKGKENNPGFNSPGLFACERPRAREGLVRRCTEAVVEDALRIFHGTRKTPGKKPKDDPCDERLWANFAWEFGYAKLCDLILQAKAEMDEHRKPIPDSEKPKFLQRLLVPFWKKRSRKAGGKL